MASSFWSRLRGDASSPTGSDVVQYTPGLSAFLSKVYRTTMGGIVLAGAGGTLAIMSGMATAVSPGVLMLGSLVTSIGSILYAQSQEPPTFQNADGSLFTTNSVARQLAVGTFFVSSGIGLSPLLMAAMAMAPGAIPLAVLASAGTMGGMSLLAMSRPQGSLLMLGGPLVAVLTGALVVSLGSLFFPAMAPLALKLHTWGGLVIFGGFTAYDTQRLIEDYAQEQRADHLGESLNFFLNFRGLFVVFLRMFLPNRD